MPRYTYRCDECEKVFDVAHSIKEKWEICEECEGILVRVPSQTFIDSGQKNTTVKHKVGGIVENHIESSKKELKREQDKLKSEEYK